MIKRKNILGIGIILTIFITLIFQYFYNYGIYKQPPSTTWSKEVTVGNGNAKINPIIIKEDQRILVAYDDVMALKVSVTDLKGKPITDKTMKIKEEFVKDTLFVKTKEGYILAYNSTSNGTGYLEKQILDKDLNLVKSERVQGVDNIHQIDNNNYILVYNDRIELIDSLREKTQEVKAKDVSLITASKSSKGYLICYIEGREFFNFFTTEGDNVSEPKLAMKLTKTDNITYEQISCSTDGKKGYILIEEELKGEFNGTKGIEFALDGSGSTITPIYINNSKAIRQNIGVYSQEGGKFYGVFGRYLGKKSFQDNVISFTLKDGKASNVEYVSRTRETCFYPYIQEDYVAYLTFNSIKNQNINIGSTNNEFKQVNNAPRGSEMLSAVTTVLEGLMYSLSFVFVYGFKWMLPIMLVAGVLAFFDYAYSEKTKLRGFIGLSIFAIAIKTYGIIPVFYDKNLHLLPDAIGSKITGIIICALIGAISYAYGYSLYKKDTEDIGIMKFLVALLIDTVMTLIIFVPFIS